jgi:signal transduction histidine kinase
VDRVTREHSGDVVVSDSGLGGTRIEMRFPLIEADRPTVEM